jgi:hypothetical protein
MAQTNHVGVSVVFTVHNDAAGTRELLEALVGQTRQPDEIVVVDAGSTDGTQEVLAAFDPDGLAFRWLLREGVNIAIGRNIAIGEAAHEIIACTDAGCVPDSRWLEELLAPLADADVSVVGGSYRVSAQSSLERVVGMLTMPGELKPVDPLRFNPSARSLAFRREAWRRAGGFPEWLMTAEDTLFACKLRRGETYAIAERAIVRWRPRGTVAAVWRQFRAYSRGEAHIGRGADTVAFWRRRYGLAAVGLLVGFFAYWAGSGPLASVAAVAAMVALMGPVHARAAAVAERTSRWVDYVRAVGISHWVALASLRGHALGRRDRKRDPHTYVTRLREYWGAAPLASTPPWSMKHVPTPRTLIVSWHWPPTNRASTQVLSNLFSVAPLGPFTALTRGLPGGWHGQSRRAGISLARCDRHVPAFRVPWLLADDRERTLLTWVASLVSVVQMVRAARRLHRETPFQSIMGVYPHRYSLLTGWLVARALNLPFVAYMHDLCAETLITRSRLKRLFWTAVDRHALRSAFMVMAPTREFALHYRSRGVLDSWVLPHVNPVGAPASRTASKAPDDALHLLYAGSVYQAHEAAVRALLQAEDLLERVHIEYMCPPNAVVPAERARWVDREAARSAIQAADVLVVALSARTPYPREIQGCFPSKLVDYLAAGKPILAIVPEGCFVDRLVRTTGCGVAVNSESPADVARMVDRLRDRSTRAEMAAAAGRLSAELAAPRWIEQMCRRLALGAPVDPSTPPFPAVQAGSLNSKPREPLAAQHA